jgi:hypothetical protein
MRRGTAKIDFLLAFCPACSYNICILGGVEVLLEEWRKLHG